MALKDVKPTRSQLIELKKRITLSKKGYKLLKMKRDGLIMEFFKMLEDAKKVRASVGENYGKGQEAIHVAEAVESGAELLLGGGRIEGQFFEPSVLVDVTADMAMSCEETFGPVAGVARFSTEEEVVRIANDTPYGLSAYFYAEGNARVWRVSEALEYGIVGINTGFVSTEVAPFGGVKESGIGREGSKYGIDEWLELKYLAIGI